MPNTWRRFEVLLPLQFNDGSPVPDEWINEAIRECLDHFGAVTYESQQVEGFWRHDEELYRDTLVRVIVDAPDRMASRRWMHKFKDRWKARLEQVDLWMVSYRVEIE